jgi:signal transduction histidine kinase/AmiR/NasT family two-component response regulator
MLTEIAIFVISLFFSGIIIFILCFLWFGDTRNRSSVSFFCLGIFVTFWTILNAVAVISDERFFPFLYTLRISFVCIIPFSVFWFVFNFSHIRTCKFKYILPVICIFPSLDVLAMITNPLHHFMFLDYAFPIPARGTGFWIHTAVDFFMVTISFFILIRYIFMHARNEPMVIAAGFGLLLPYILNLLFTVEIRFIPYDITSLGFFVTFMLFAVSSYRSQLLNIKALTLTNVYALLKDIILVIDDRHRIMDANPAAMTAFPGFLFDAGQSTLEKLTNYLHERNAECIPEDLFGSLKTGNKEPQPSLTTGKLLGVEPEVRGSPLERSGNLKLYRNDGKMITFIVTVKPILLRKKPTSYIIIMSDVSVYHSMISEINEQNARLAELRKEAEAASKAKSTFLANMSHEIRTPLNAVIGMALVAQKNAENIKTLSAIQEIENASVHLLGLLNNVLDISKIESGKFELINEAFYLKAAMDEVVKLISPRCAEKNISLDTNFENINNYSVIGDKLRLNQILLNLLGNAVKFSPVNSAVVFSLFVREENEETVKIQFRIADNGIGITEEQKGKLFQSFSQAYSGIFNQYGGTGLGLSISQNLVEMMGGHITVKSKIGEGSTFEFTLSFLKEEEKKESVSGEVMPDLRGKRILIAEDIQINRFILKELLAETNAEIDEAADGEIAVDVFGAKPFNYYDIIFMDIQMPMMDGYEATRRIRAIEAEMIKNEDAKGNKGPYKQVKIIAMTANAYKEDIEKAIASGMNEHLSKPVDINTVMQTLLSFCKE